MVSGYRLLQVVRPSKRTGKPRNVSEH